MSEEEKESKRELQEYLNSLRELWLYFRDLRDNNQLSYRCLLLWDETIARLNECEIVCTYDFMRPKFMCN
jgi:hypothetical protein